MKYKLKLFYIVLAGSILIGALFLIKYYDRPPVWHPQYMSESLPITINDTFTFESLFAINGEFPPDKVLKHRYQKEQLVEILGRLIPLPIEEWPTIMNDGGWGPCITITTSKNEVKTDIVFSSSGLVNAGDGTSEERTWFTCSLEDYEIVNDLFYEDFATIRK